MKIAIFHNLPPGGAKRVVYHQAKFLSKNHQVYLYKLTSTDESFLNLQPLADKVISFQFNFSRHLPCFLGRLQLDYKSLFSLKKLHRAIAEDINTSGVDAVLAHPDQYTQAPFLLRFISAPSLYYCHELLRLAYEPELQEERQLNFIQKHYDNALLRLKKTIDKNNAKSASKILTNSKFTGKKILSAYGRKAQICYPGVDINVFKSIRVKTTPTILFVGEKIKSSGFNLLQKALQIIKLKPKPKLRVISFKQGRPSLTTAQLVKAYNQAIVTICLSVNEPFGLIPLESMACGTPVIALNQGGYKETILADKTGFLIQPNPQILASKISQLVNNSDLRRKMIRASKSHVAKSWTWKNHGIKLQQTLKLIAAQKR